MSVDAEQNRLLHLALAAGIARHCLKFLAQGSFGECIDFSRKHLESPAFAALDKALRDVAAFEIFEIVKDGASLPDRGRQLLTDVGKGDYALCWRYANMMLASHGPGYPHVEAGTIDPALLV
ncbi:MAG TPA: hypothetical protein VJ694_00885 [Patescibacteria group bacterium]|nr:hypothetical protein [Patescibacteria group bacterium]